jgi:hypothetical protein
MSSSSSSSTPAAAAASDPLAKAAADDLAKAAAKAAKAKSAKALAVYYDELTQFAIKVNSSWSNSRATSAALCEAFEQLDAAMVTPDLCQHLIITINAALAIDRKDPVVITGKDEQGKVVSSERVGRAICPPGRSGKIDPEAMESILQILKAMRSLPHIAASFSDFVNVRLLNRSDEDIRHLLFKNPPSAESCKNWKFSPGQLKLTSDVTKIPFTRLQHCVHDLADVITILNASSGKATFTGGWNEESSYQGVDGWWLAPLITGAAINTSVTSLNPYDSRYGNVRFTFPVLKPLSSRNNQYLFGTRKYTREFSHTILLSDNKVRGLGVDIPTVDLANNPLVHWTAGSNEAVWKCTRQLPGAWDHLEFAVECDQPMVFDPAVDGVRIDFTTHDDFCVRHKRAINAGGEHLKDLPCKCASVQQAMGEFKLACRAAKISLDDLNNAGFFEPEVWTALQKAGTATGASFSAAAIPTALAEPVSKKRKLDGSDASTVPAAAAASSSSSSGAAAASADMDAE